MSRDMKPKRPAAAKKSSGSTLVGLFIGLVLGIVGAAAVVWYVNKMPAPFKQPQAQPPTSKPEAADKGARTPGADPAPLPGKPGDPTPEKRFQFYDILPGKSEAKVEAKVEPTPEADGKSKEAKEKSVANKETIYLQAGSFQSAGDADNQKAKLALIGVEASVQQVMVQDKVWYRVRLGPYAKPEEVSRVRADLAKQGIDVAVVKKD